MLMKKELRRWTAEEKERILHDIQRLGVTVGRRKYNLSSNLYYTWLNRYNAHGLEGLEDRRGKDLEAHNLEIGLLINFGARRPGFKRLLNRNYSPDKGNQFNPKI